MRQRLAKLLFPDCFCFPNGKVAKVVSIYKTRSKSVQRLDYMGEWKVISIQENKGEYVSRWSDGIGNIKVYS